MCELQQVTNLFNMTADCKVTELLYYRRVL